MKTNLPAKLAPTLVTHCRYSKLRTLCAEFEAKQKQARKVVELLAMDSEVEAVLYRLQVLANEVEQRLLSRSENSVDITSESMDLLDLLDSDFSALRKVDAATIKKYSRRLYAKHHPDRGGDPSVFQSIKALVKAKHLEGLYLMLLDTDFSDADDSVLTKTIQRMYGRLEQLPASNSWKILYTYLSCGKEKAKSELLRMLEIKCEKTSYLLLGLTT